MSEDGNVTPEEAAELIPQMVAAREQMGQRNQHAIDKLCALNASLNARAEAAESALATAKAMWSEERDVRAKAEASLAAAIAALRELRDARLAVQEGGAVDTVLIMRGTRFQRAWDAGDRIVADYDASQKAEIGYQGACPECGVAESERHRAWCHKLKAEWPEERGQ